MRRVLRVLLVVVLLIVLALGGLVFHTVGGLRSPAEHQDLPGLGFVARDGYSGFGVLEAGGGKVVLIDAGNDRSGAPVLAALKSAGHAAEDVAAVFLTHGHPDHVAAISALPGARVYAMAAEQPFLEGREAWKGPLPRLFGASDSGVRLAGALSDGAVTEVGDLRVEGFAVPGHTAGSAVWLVRDALFLGDSADIQKDGHLRPAPWVFSDDTAHNRTSLRALAQRLAPRAAEVRWLVPAHSGASEDGLKPLLEFQG